MTLRIISWGGIGDAVLTTPCFREFKRIHPHGRLKVFWRNAGHYDVFKGNPHIDVLKPARFGAAPLEFLRYLRHPSDYVLPAYGQIRPALFPVKHATALMADILGLAITDLKPEIHLTAEEEASARARLAAYETPVAIHVTSKCSANQNWPIAHWEALIEQNPDCTFVQLGATGERPIRGAIDLLGRTTLRETFAILKCVKSFVGVDSALQNATAAFGTPGVVLFAASLPTIWGHTNNINLYNEVPCAPCIDILKGAPCPYGVRCMHEITPDTVTAALRTQLGGRRVAQVTPESTEHSPELVLAHGAGGGSTV